MMLLACYHKGMMVQKYDRLLLTLGCLNTEPDLLDLEIVR